MKLLYCNQCADLFNLSRDPRTCECGASSGAYESDGWHAWVTGPVTPLGFENGSFDAALLNQPGSGEGKRFDAFVIPKECETVKIRE